MILTEKMQLQGAWLFKYRSILPLILFVLGIILFVENEMNPENWILKDELHKNLYEMLCLLISILGLFIRIYTVGYSRPNTSGRNTNEQVAEVLNTTGIYSMLRNPLYLGNFFMWLGIAMLSGNSWFVISFNLFY